MKSQVGFLDVVGKRFNYSFDSTYAYIYELTAKNSVMFLLSIKFFSNKLLSCENLTFYLPRYKLSASKVSVNFFFDVHSSVFKNESDLDFFWTNISRR